MSTVVEVSVPTVPTEPKTGTKTRPEVFLDAAALLEEHGWTTGYLVDNEGKMCILGAVGRALGMWIYPFTNDDNEDVYAAAGEFIGADPEEVFGWNDDPRDDENGLAQVGVGQERAAEALRRLANGESWKEITSS